MVSEDSLKKKRTHTQAFRQRCDPLHSLFSFDDFHNSKPNPVQIKQKMAAFLFISICSNFSFSLTYMLNVKKEFSLP